LGGQTVAATLRARLPGARIAERVKVVDASGTRVGDLDVVAYDKSSGTIAVFEVLWSIAPDGSAEVAKVETHAHEKRAQVARVRQAMADKEAAARWPPGWIVDPGANVTWFILTPSVLPALSLQEDGIFVRSHQLLARIRWDGSSVDDMVRAMLNPPPPPEELSVTEWGTLRYGAYRVEVETFRV
jgi:hypothetical protein